MVPTSIRRAFALSVGDVARLQLRRGIAALLGLALLVSGVLAEVEASPARAEETIKLEIATSTAVAVSPGGQLPMTFTVTNDTSEAIDAGEIVVTSQLVVLDSIVALDEWLSASDGLTQPGRVLTFIQVPSLAAGESTTLSQNLDVSSLAYGSTWGPRGVAADFKLENESVATARTAFVWTPGAAPSQAKFSVIAPVITPASETGLLDSGELEKLTGPTGLLTRELAFVSSHPVSVAVDPRIIASIQALGNQAPASATEWLRKLTALSNDSFSLAFSDADLAGQAQSGAGSVIPSTALTVAAPVVTDSSTPSPTPTPSALTWTPTLSGLGWPAENSVIATDLPVLAASGYGVVILGSGNIASTGNPALISTPSGNAIVTNDAVSAALRRASSATSESSYAASLGESSVYLAAAALDPTTGGFLTAGLDRVVTESQDFNRAGQALEALRTLPWVASASLSGVLATAPVVAAIADRPESTERISVLSAITGRYAALTTFSTITADPALFLSPIQQEANAVLGLGWVGDTQWSTAVGTFLHDSYDTLQSVAVVSSSTVNMVGGQANIPISVQNNLAQPVTVIVRADPSNARLAVAADETITIQPESQGKARIPVKARVGNGSVALDVVLLTPDGIPIGGATTIPINVRADWEVWGLGALGVLFVALLTVGTIRTLRRRKVAPTSEGGDSHA